jgi:mono/diheme cytochrome c family protein
VIGSTLGENVGFSGFPKKIVTSHLRFVGTVRRNHVIDNKPHPASLRLLPWAEAPLAILASLLLAFGAHAQAPNPEDVADGMRLYRQKGDCQACHGWAADGRKMDTQMPDGANLRTTRLNREGLVTAIKCGRPGKGMPAFDRLAYSDGRCYGMKQADLTRLSLQLNDPAATLQPREVEMLVDFLMAKVVGKGPMDRAKCIEYWGSDVEACGEFPK